MIVGCEATDACGTHTTSRRDWESDMTIDLLGPVASNSFATDVPRLFARLSGFSGLFGSSG